VTEYIFSLAGLGIALILTADVLIIYASIYALRRNHSGEVYVIWYAFSFFFVLFVGLTLIAIANNASVFDICGTHKDTCQTAYDHMTDPKAEAVFLAALVFLAIVPQLLTYLISGLFGTASTPRYVKHVQAVVVWSAIKFLSSLGGIIVSQSLALLIAKATFFEPQLGNVPHIGIGFVLRTGASFVAAAFLIAAVYMKLNAVSATFLKEHGFPPALMAFHEWCTRHVPETPPYTPTRTALIKLLETDAVYDFIAQNREKT
jgi:hypothetical protein